MAPRRKPPPAPAAVTSAALYLRVSTDEQATSGLGLASQLDRCHAQAIVKGWAVASHHIVRTNWRKAWIWRSIALNPQPLRKTL